MAEAQTTAKDRAEIPYGQIEFAVSFKNPIVEAWRDIAKLIPAVLSGLEPFGFKLDGVELKVQAEKLNDRFKIFRRATPGVWRDCRSNSPRGADFMGSHQISGQGGWLEMNLFVPSKKNASKLENRRVILRISPASLSLCRLRFSGFAT
jgi:hypothetical protein